MLPDIQALIDGAKQGNQTMRGVMPSGNNVGGAPPSSLDPFGSQISQLHMMAMDLSAQMHRAHNEKDANFFLELATKIQSKALERRKQFATQAADQASGGGNPALGLNAMGAPGGM